MKVVSWKGNNINDGASYTAGLVGPVLGLPAVGVGRVGRLGGWPSVSGIERPGRVLVVDIILLGTVGTQQGELAGWFDPEDETAGRLVVSDNDGGNQRYVMALCEQLVEVEGSWGNNFQAILVVDGDVRWRRVTGTSVEWLITGTGQTKVVANGGADVGYPALTIEPTAVKDGGYAYKRPLFVRWRLSEGATGYPVDVTDGSLDILALLSDSSRTVQINSGGGISDEDVEIPYDTEVGTFPSSGLARISNEQISYTGKSGGNLTGVNRGVNGTTPVSHADNAVISASKVQQDGDDIRLRVDGVEVDCWVPSITTSAGQVWANLDFGPKAEALTSAAIAGSGSVETIDVVGSNGKPGDISGFPAAGALLIDSECFVYTAKNDVLGRFLGVTRASRGTSMASHSAGATAWWVQHEIWLLYGNPDAVARVVNDNREPVFTYDSSTNELWDFQLYFGEDPVPRPGSWFIQEWVEQPPGATVVFYTSNKLAYTSLWSEIGIQVKNVVQQGAGQIPRGRWAFYNPCGVTNIDATEGEKYVESALGEWYGEIQSSVDGNRWVSEYVIPAPGSADAWQSWSQDQALDSGSKFVGLMLRVPEGGGRIDDRRVELRFAEVTLNSSNTPVVTVGAAGGNYSLDCRITNVTTGVAIDLDFVMDLNGELVVDSDLKTVVYLDDGSSQFQALTLVGGARRVWLGLAAGNNTLQFDDVGTAGVTVTVDFEGRDYQ